MLSAENKAAVAEARAAGIDVVIVTGRSWRGTREYYEALGLTGPAICYLGAVTVADPAGRISHYRPLVPAAWETVREFALREGLALTACAGTDQTVADGELPAHDLIAADVAYATRKADDFVDWEGWNTYTEIAPDLSPVKGPPIMVAVYGDRAVKRVTDQFPQGLPHSQFDLTDRIAGETVLHIWHDSVDKGWALAEFCRDRGFSAGEVMAVGDAVMDLSMIRFAGIGVAVPDGHAALRAAADWVATPADAIRRVLQGRRP